MARLAFPLLVAVGLLAVLHAPQTCFPGQGLWRRLRGKVEQPRHLSVRAAAENPLKAVGLSNGVVAEVSEKDKFQAEVSRGTQESTNLRPFEQTIAAEAVADIVEAQPPAAKKTPVEKQPEAEKAQAVAPVLQPPPAPKKSEAARAVDAVPAPAPRSESSVPKEPSSGLFDFARLAEGARASEREAAKLDWGFLQKSLWSTTAEAFEYAAKDGQGGSLLFGGVALATFVALGLGLSALQPAGAPVRSPPAPVVVTVQQTAPAPKAIEPVAPAPVSPAPIAPAAVAPKSATPAAPATAKPVQPITSIKSPAPVASPVSQTEARSTASAPVTSPVSGPVELPWARTLAEVTAGGLKQLSDGLPAAERQLEANVPTIIKTAEWTSTVNPDNIQSKVQEALPVVGGVVVGAESACFFTELPQETRSRILAFLWPASCLVLQQSSASCRLAFPRKNIDEHSSELWFTRRFSPVWNCGEQRLFTLLRGSLKEDANAVYAMLVASACPDVNAPAGHPPTPPLCVAAARGYKATLRLLLQHRASLNLADGDGLSALDVTISYGRVDCVSMLLDLGAKSLHPHEALRVSSCYPDLFKACAHRLVVECDADADAAMDSAFELGDVENALALMECPGASDRSWMRQWALRRAAILGHMPSLAKVLCLPGVDLEDGAGGAHGTALLLAAEGGNDEACRFLLSRRANMSAARVEGGVRWTALDLARRRGHRPTVELLSEAQQRMDRGGTQYGAAQQLLDLAALTAQGDWIVDARHCRAEDAI